MSASGNVFHDFIDEVYGARDVCIDAGPSRSRNSGGSPALRQISDLAPDHQGFFAGYKEFNRVQTAVFDAVYLSDQNVVVSAPTASGKTTIFELAILRLFKHRSRQNVTRKPRRADFKAVYIAPLKAICSEKLTEWRPKFAQLGLDCVDYTGDSETNIYNLATSDIIITTPEKLDVSSRKWQEYKFVFDQIGLVLIDELHAIDEERSRGVCLEALITRFLTISTRKTSMKEECPASSIRVIALSATAPNIEELGEWLNAAVFKFGDEFRPVPLKLFTIGNPMGRKFYAWDTLANEKVLDVIREYNPQGRPTLIFCSSRSGCFQCAKKVLQCATEKRYRLLTSSVDKGVLAEYARKLNDNRLAPVFAEGIGTYHAGLTQHDKQIMTSTFLAGRLKVLCSTTSLAMGVNLPAHLVLVKGTQTYDPTRHACVEQPASTILQMIGRAGRPQFDSFGVAVVMTTKNMVGVYSKILHGQKAIDSRLFAGNPVEHINAEISMRTITTIGEAVVWLRHTFGAVRMRKHPVQFGEPPACVTDPVAFQRALESRVNHNVTLLAEAGMVNVMANTTGLMPTKLGNIMARYYLQLETAKALTSIRGDIDLGGMLRAICTSAEFSDLRIRLGEKKVLNAANKPETIRYPFKDKVKTLEDKIFVIIQVGLQKGPTTSPFESFQLDKDTASAIDIGCRILSAVEEYYRECNDQFSAYSNAIRLKKSLSLRMWPDSQHMLRQIDGIGPKKVDQLKNAGIQSIGNLREASTTKIEAVCDRHPPFGLQVKQRLALFPALELRIEADNTSIDWTRPVHVRLAVAQQNPEFRPKSETSVYVIVGLSDQTVVLSRRINLAAGASEMKFDITIPMRCQNLHLHCFAIHASLAGIDVEHVHYFSNIDHQRDNENLQTGPQAGSKREKRKAACPTESQRTFMKTRLSQCGAAPKRIRGPQPAASAFVSAAFDRLSGQGSNCPTVPDGNKSAGAHQAVPTQLLGRTAPSPSTPISNTTNAARSAINVNLGHINPGSSTSAGVASTCQTSSGAALVSKMPPPHVSAPSARFSTTPQPRALESNIGYVKPNLGLGVNLHPLPPACFHQPPDQSSCTFAQTGQRLSDSTAVQPPSILAFRDNDFCDAALLTFTDLFS
ncbi:hypothetical protein PBRA_006359 [Plasmodiophora brassicae]|uniref:Uncharacterized protein n=1 Tax=Plasmodiophora brassicae TaxID=37360 RepID=A0A0G4ISK6_PLABS|nr:hypothetical protein PBRA_006359 [Plasmodiophora brassicae]